MSSQLFFREHRCRFWYSMLAKFLMYVIWLRSFTAVHEDVPKCMPETLRVAVVYATGCNSPQIAGSTPALRLENACQLDWYTK